MPEAADAPVILSNVPGSFARSVLAERHPALIEKVRNAFPYGPGQHRALDGLLRQITDGVIDPLGPDAHDRDRWEAWGRGHVGQGWFDAPFLWAESYFYRRLLDAVGYFVEGPWQGIDPFRPFKLAELHTAKADEEMAVLNRLALRPVAEQARALVLSSLWGNRADLGFRLSSGDSAAAGTAAAGGAAADGVAADDGGTTVGSEPADSGASDSGATDSGAADDADSRLVVDDSALLWSLLRAGRPATLCVVADNAGRELLPDLILIDHVLVHQHAERVVLQVKPYPYYVSDATTADVIDCLHRLRGARGVAAEVGKRLWSAMASGRLTVRAHAFACAPLPYADMPGDLRREFAESTLTVMKGDLNYRRLVGDQLWAPTTAFADRTAYFPGPVAALRTLKSDVIVGLDRQTEAALISAHGQRWRTSGTHALIQVRA